MRLWHYKLIPYLPNSQLIAQWRELNSIFKNQPKHILINYVYEYSKENLYWYTVIVTNELNKRNIKIKSLINMETYFAKDLIIGIKNPLSIFSNHHNQRYLMQCFYNLQEKYDRGQKDFNEETYEKLVRFVNDCILIDSIKSSNNTIEEDEDYIGLTD